MLRGPADADAFRVQVGRYGDRFYHDPLPTCAVATATDDVWPSVSAVKNAWPKYLTAWAAQEVARFAVDNLDTIAALDHDAAIALLSKAHERSRDNAAGRGSGVHAILEAKGENRPAPPWAVVDAAEWGPAAELLVAEVQPEWVLSEAVVINRRLGVGGTLDAVWRINGRNYLVDFKTRKAGKHGAYKDEGAQLAAYGTADYAIVERDGRAVRVAMPELAGAYVVSITPEGYRLFPVGLADFYTVFAALHGFWKAMQSCNIGKPVVLRPDEDAPAPKTSRKKKTTAPPAADTTNVLPLPVNPESLRARVLSIIEAGHGDTLATMWPPDVPTFKRGPLDQDQLRRVAELVSRVEGHFEMPFDALPPLADDLRFALREFSPDEQAALVADAGKGKALENFGTRDADRLRLLLDGIDKLRVAFTYDGQVPALVITK